MKEGRELVDSAPASSRPWARGSRSYASTSWWPAWRRAAERRARNRPRPAESGRDAAYLFLSEIWPRIAPPGWSPVCDVEVEALGPALHAREGGRLLALGRDARGRRARLAGLRLLEVDHHRARPCSDPPLWMWAATGLRDAAGPRSSNRASCRSRWPWPSRSRRRRRRPSSGLGVDLLGAGEHRRQRAGIPLWHGLADRDGHGGDADGRRPGLKQQASFHGGQPNPQRAALCACFSSFFTTLAGWGSAAAARGSAPPRPAARPAAATARGCRARRRRSGPASPRRTVHRALEQRDRLVVAALVHQLEARAGSATPGRSRRFGSAGRLLGARAPAAAALALGPRARARRSGSAGRSAGGRPAPVRRRRRRRRRARRSRRRRRARARRAAAATGSQAGAARAAALAGRAGSGAVALLGEAALERRRQLAGGRGPVRGVRRHAALERLAPRRPGRRARPRAGRAAARWPPGGRSPSGVAPWRALRPDSASKATAASEYTSAAGPAVVALELLGRHVRGRAEHGAAHA